ncbi:MAG: hypothetical protein FWD55_01400 [Propionibacteriaceae bacterium]|nr:hypothetical protein [Propionibacteriaceae bacterium]
MDKVRVVGVVVGILLIAAFASCTDASTPPINTTSGSVSTTPSPSVLITELPSDYPPDSVLLGELSSRHGTAELGPYVVATPSVAVFIRCFGESQLQITIPGVGELDQDCVDDPLDPGTMHVFDVRYVDTVTVRASSDNSNLWAIAVTEH